MDRTEELRPAGMQSVQGVQDLQAEKHLRRINIVTWINTIANVLGTVILIIIALSK